MTVEQLNKIADTIESFKIQLFSDDEVLRISVAEINVARSFNESGVINPGGLYDLRLGATKTEKCQTCSNNYFNCGGHFGHIALPLPLYNPFLMRLTYQLFEMTCPKCRRLLVRPIEKDMLLLHLNLLDLDLEHYCGVVKDFSHEFYALETDSGQTYDEMKEKLHNKLKEAGILKEITKRRAEKDRYSNHKYVKAVVDRKHQLIRDFMKRRTMGFLKACAFCGHKRNTYSLINSSTIQIQLKENQTLSDEFGELSRTDPILGDKILEKIDKNKKVVNPLVVRTYLRELWINENQLLEKILPFVSEMNFDMDSSVKAINPLESLITNKSLGSPSPMDVFFCNYVLVTPSKFRPLRFMNGRQFEDSKSSRLNTLISSANSLRKVYLSLMESDKTQIQVEAKSKMTSKRSAKKVLEMASRDSATELFYRFWNEAQINFNLILDADLAPKKAFRATSVIPGVKQLIEKKEGLFRKNMMGKRVNYAARSVISPDPYIMVDEIGFPEIFAKRLSFPEPVNDHNYEMLKQLVQNGPDIYPGALSVVMENGNIVRLNPKDASQRNSIAQSVCFNVSGKMNPDMRVKVVNRHLRSGDVLLINRQPTLHKPSIMAHRARVLPGEKTIRLHYANCKCYNADFDGDEMNAHFPQSFLTRAEGYNIVSVNYQYLVPKDGTPLSGLIQDHIVAATMLTYRGQFFNQSDYHNLVFAAVSFINRRIKFLPPAIMKPVNLWSGKQIASTILLNLIPEDKIPPNLTIASKLKPSIFVTQTPRVPKVGGALKATEMCESEVIIREGQLLVGVFDKSNLGNTSYGMVHTCYELFGGEVSSAVLTAFARLANCYLQTICGFTLGIYDILVTEQADKQRKKLIQQSTEIGDEAVAAAFNVTDVNNKEELYEEFREAHTSSNPLFIKMLDASVKSRTDEISNNISKQCLPAGLLKPFPYNHLQMMIQPGAKGGMVNAMQISCLLGQIELEGKRVPRMISGKTLPSFPPYETSPKAGGFVTGRFLTGIRPQEFFFHCMAGREGLIDTAVKTSRSGYLQRCLIKHLEGLIVGYDNTVRDSDNTVIQYLYGEDGLDILKSQLLKPKAIPMICENIDSFRMDKEDYSRVKKCTNKKLIKSHGEKISNWEKVNGNDRLARKRGTAFPRFFEKSWSKISEEDKNNKSSRDLILKNIFNSWFEMNREDRRNLNYYCGSCPDPLTFKLNPSRNFGVISERMEHLMEKYIDDNPAGLLISKQDLQELETQPENKIKESDFRKAFYARYQKSLCEPGEAVGLLAAQSIGEPSTQMTLNTFHFAGRGEMNVTLGIPRLREILMTASPNISTPSMDIPLRRDLPVDEIENLADQVRIQMNSVTLADVLEHVEIEDVYEITPTRCAHLYKIKFKFLRRRYFKHKYSTTLSQILTYFENKFVPLLSKAIRRKIAIQKRSKTLVDSNLSKAMRSDDNGAVDEDDENAMESRSALLNRIGEDESEDSDDENGDGDADDLKHRGVRDQELTYEEPEEEEQEQSESDIENEETEAADAAESGDVSSKKNQTTEDLEEDKEADEDNAGQVRPTSTGQAKASKYIDQHVVDLRKDEQKEQWCELTLSFGLAEPRIDLATLIQEEAKKAVMYKVGSIEKAFLVKNPNAVEGEYEQMIKTEGVNFLSLIRFSNIIDLNRVYSNDIHAIANTYGIEAGRKAIVSEMVNVFGMYGIEIDPRHLNLIADYMTSSGVIRGMNRQSMQANASPIQQITFETSMNFIKGATMLGVTDQVSSPSSRIFVGRPVTAGSGASMCVMPSPVHEEPETDILSSNCCDEDPKKRKYLNLNTSAANTSVTSICSKRIRFA